MLVTLQVLLLLLTFCLRENRKKAEEGDGERYRLPVASLVGDPTEPKPVLDKG